MTLSAVQSAVAQQPLIGIVGEPYDSDCTIVSKRAVAATPFGVVVSFLVEGDGTLPDATGEITGIHGAGVVLRDPTKASGVGYESGDMMRVMIRGRAFVLAEETVVVTDTPFARFASGGGGTQLGAFRNDADTATCVALPNSRFFKGGGTTSPPVVELI